MAKPERTMQQMNPIGQGGMWDVALTMGLSAWAYITIMCVAQTNTATYPNLLIAAFVFFTTAIIMHIWAANPQHGPYRSSQYHWVAGLATAGAISQLFAMHTNDLKMAVVWGPVAVAYLLASASVFRPSLDQVLTGIAVIVSLGATVFIDGQAIDHPFGITYVAIATVGIVVIIIMGQASYTGVATRTLDAWSRDSEHTLEDSTALVRELVSADVTATLSQEFHDEAEPLLAKVIQSGRITAADVEEARSLATRVRNRLLYLNAQNWLQAAGSEVEDHDGLVDCIDDAVRSALVALCVGIDAARLGRPTFVLTRGTPKGSINFTVRAEVGSNLARTRVELAPYIRVIYVVFEDVRVSFRGAELSLKFKYGERK